MRRRRRARTREFCSTLVIDAVDAAPRRRGRGRGRARGRRRHDDAQPRDRGRARARDTLAAVRRDRVAHDHPDRGHRRDPARRRARGAHRRRGRARRARRSPTATASSSPRRSCRRPRAGSCRSTPTTSTRARALVESESVRIVRRRGDLIISETRHGFVCANAGIDLSNVDDGLGRAAARRRRPVGQAHPRRAARARPASRSRSIISDTFGRPWRHGLTDVAIGVSGIAAVVDLRDTHRRARAAILHVTEVAIADEIAAAAELVMGKAAGVPVAIVRGLDPTWFRDGSYRELDPPAERGPVPMTARYRARVPRSRAARSARSRPSRSPRDDARRARRSRVHRARAAPLAPVALRRRRHRRRPSTRSPPAWARAGAPTSPATASTPARIDELVDASHAQARAARRRSCSAASRGTASTATPTSARRRAEWGMALLSLGAAVENLMLAAADRGLASCWVAAPIFCPEDARDALALPDGVAAARARAGRPPRPRLRRAAPARRSPSTSLRRFAWTAQPSTLSCGAQARSAGARCAFEVLERAGDAFFERR